MGFPIPVRSLFWIRAQLCILIRQGIVVSQALYSLSGRTVQDQISQKTLEAVRYVFKIYQSLYHLINAAEVPILILINANLMMITWSRRILSISIKTRINSCYGQRDIAEIKKKKKWKITCNELPQKHFARCLPFPIYIKICLNFQRDVIKSLYISFNCYQLLLFHQRLTLFTNRNMTIQLAFIWRNHFDILYLFYNAPFIWFYFC